MPFDRENDDQPTMLAQRIEWKTPFLDTKEHIWYLWMFIPPNETGILQVLAHPPLLTIVTLCG
jgi:hypothetical protein